MDSRDQKAPRKISKGIALAFWVIGVGLHGYYLYAERHNMVPDYWILLASSALVLFASFYLIAIAYRDRQAIVKPLGRWVTTERICFCLGALTILVVGLVISSHIYLYNLATAVPVESSPIAAETKELDETIATLKAGSAEQQRLIKSLSSALHSAARAMGKNPEEFISDPAEPMLGPIDLVTRTGVTPDAYGSVIERFRADRRLRASTEEELGLPLPKVPSETYYFASAGWLALRPTRGQAFVAKLERISTVNRRTFITEIFELHTLQSGEIHLIGFADEATVARSNNLDGRTEHSLIVYPSPSGTRSALISIPASRILSSDMRQMAQNALELTIR